MAKETQNVRYRGGGEEKRESSERTQDHHSVIEGEGRGRRAKHVRDKSMLISRQNIEYCRPHIDRH